MPEEPKTASLTGSGAGHRSPFARDRARVLHSAALRRLADKTQVVGPRDGDTPRTRLTHSLEVAQIGRGIATELGCDPDLVDAAGLAHDIGHPPYGHNGERALDEVADRCGGFEGNAQNLRILTRLEPKVLDEHGHSAGLNLTRAALDAATKYPWTRRVGQPKFGAYSDDAEALEWVRFGAPADRQCLEAQVMEWSDDVAYSVHDLEDGVLAGLVRLEDLRGPVEREELSVLAAQVYSGESAADLREVLDALLDQPFWPRSYDGSATASAALKHATSTLIGRFCCAAEDATRAEHGPEPLTRYTADLVVPRQVRAECALLKAVADRYVMGRPGASALQTREREVVAELVQVLLERAPDVLEPAYAQAWQAAPDDAGRLRSVVDQVAILTDAAAAAMHARLTAPASSTGSVVGPAAH